MNRTRTTRYPQFTALLGRRPQAFASIQGSVQYADIRGTARFWGTSYGVLTVVELQGLPAPRGICESPIFALHIHDGGRCAGDESDPFADAMMHYNPHLCKHPYHAGDLPPLLGASGYAFSASLSNRFTVQEILGKTIIVHANPDDFTTQPSGNAGPKIACGVIQGR